MKSLMALFGAVGLLSMAAPVSAACAPDSGVVLYYGNGMLISPARARVQALLMDKKLRPALSPGANVTSSYAYNNSEDIYDQLLQAVGQAALGKPAIRVPSLPSLPAAPSAPSLPSFPDIPTVTEAIKAIQIAIDADKYVKDRDLDAHVLRYKADLAAGKRVIVLAHSQGNFYANKAYERLTSKAGFGIVSLGTPASFTAGNGPYTTLTSDEIIKHVPNRREPNTTNSAAFLEATRGTDGHSFTAHYLDGDVSGPQIVGQVKSVLAGLGCPVTP